MSELLKLININYEIFHQQIEELINNKNIEYIDAVIHWCELNNVELEQAAAYIKRNQVMKIKIQEEAEKLNMIHKSSKLLVEI